MALMRLERTLVVDKPQVVALHELPLAPRPPGVLERWLPAVREHGRKLGEFSRKAGELSLKKLSEAGSEAHARGRALAERWLPVAREKGRVLGERARAAGQESMELLARTASDAQARGRAVAERWVPVAQRHGRALTAQAQAKSSEWLSSLANQSNELARQGKERAKLWLRGAPLEAEVLECLRAAGETEAAGEVQRQWQCLHDLLCKVVVFGEFSAGKSTLLNALLGRALLHEDVVPSTGQVTRLEYDAEEKVLALLTTGEIKTTDFASLKAWTTLNEAGATRIDVEEVRVGLVAPLLENGVCLIDTPGSSDPGAGGDKVEQVARTLHAFGRADVVLWVLHADRLLRDSEIALTDRLVAAHPAVQLVPVVNFMPSLSEKGRHLLRQRAAQMLEARFPGNVTMVRRHSAGGEPFLEVDARQAQDDPAGGTDDFGRLQGLLRRLGTEERPAIQAARLARVRATLAAAAARNAGSLRSAQAEAALQREAHAARRRLAEEWLRHFGARAETEWVAVRAAGRQLLETSLETFTDDELYGKKAKWLYENVQALTREHLGKFHCVLNLLVYDKIGFGARESGLAHGPRPETGGVFWLSSLAVEKPPWAAYFTDNSRRAYAKQVRLEVERVWMKAGETLMERAGAWWRERISHFTAGYRHREVRGKLDAAATSEAHVEIKARDLRLQKGGRRSLLNRLSSPDTATALVHLRARMQEGEYISPALLHRETLDTALAAMQKHLAETGAQPQPSRPRTS
jgi:hypothetical protein